MNQKIHNLKDNLNRNNSKYCNTNINSTQTSIENKSENLSNNLFYSTNNSNNIDLNSSLLKNDSKKIVVDSNILYYILTQLNHNNEINTIFYNEYSKIFKNIYQKLENITELKNQITILNKFNEKIYQMLTNKRNREINYNLENSQLNQTLELSLNEKEQSLENKEINLNDILDRTISNIDFKNIPIEESFLINQSVIKEERKNNQKNLIFEIQKNNFNKFINYLYNSIPNNQTLFYGIPKKSSLEILDNNILNFRNNSFKKHIIIFGKDNLNFNRDFKYVFTFLKCNSQSFVGIINLSLASDYRLNFSSCKSKSSILFSTKTKIFNYLTKKKGIKLSTGRVEDGDFVVFKYEFSYRALIINYKGFNEIIEIKSEDIKNDVFRIGIFFQGYGSEIKVENIY